MNSQFKSLTPEVLVPKIGDYLIDHGFISQNDLQKALILQSEKEKSENPKLLGQILVEMEAIDQETLDQVVTEQIIQLKNALESSNNNLEKRVKERTIALEKALIENKKLNEFKSNLISNISHELRTPLTHIKGYLSLLMDGDLGEIPQTQVEVFGIMNKATERLEKLIDELIMFTLGENDELHLSKEKFDLISLTSRVILKYQIKKPDRKLIIKNRNNENEIIVFADQEKIEWVISHLLENAIKFSKVESPITIDIDSNYDIVNISVVDLGIGISEEKLIDIFEPFHQVDSSSTRKYDGIGIGLALVNKIIKAHESKLNVHSIINQGSKFDFSLRRWIK